MPHSEVARKAFTVGTHRLIEPGATLERAERLFPHFGITRVANLTGLDRIGIPVVMVCRPNARSSAVFHGKGIDLQAAKASGVMEAIETWHGEHADLPLRFGSFDELQARLDLCDVEALPSQTNARFDHAAPLLWTQGRNLVSDRPIWVPYELIHANATGSAPQSSGSFAATTNGLASGNHILEATSHALCEVIERDATSLWRRSPAREQDARLLDPSSVDDSACRSLLERYEAASIDVGIWETTTDIGVASFQCLIVDRIDPFGHIGTGAGCHPSRSIALIRALTEAAQTRMTYTLGSREDIGRADYAQDALSGRNGAAREMIGRAVGRRSFGLAPDHRFEDFDDEIGWLAARLGNAGFGEVVAVDLTQSVLAIPVVRVLVPGLEGSDRHPGYTPGPRARVAGEGRPP